MLGPLPIRDRNCFVALVTLMSVQQNCTPCLPDLLYSRIECEPDVTFGGC